MSRPYFHMHPLGDAKAGLGILAALEARIARPLGKEVFKRPVKVTQGLLKQLQPF